MGKSLIGAMAVVAFAGIVASGSKYVFVFENSAIPNIVDGEAKNFAKYGKLTADLSCTEQEKMSRKLGDYFAGLAKDGATNPTFVITKEDCLKLMAEKQATSTASAPAPVGP